VIPKWTSRRSRSMVCIDRSWSRRSSTIKSIIGFSGLISTEVNCPSPAPSAAAPLSVGDLPPTRRASHEWREGRIRGGEYHALVPQKYRAHGDREVAYGVSRRWCLFDQGEWYSERGLCALHYVSLVSCIIEDIVILLHKMMQSMTSYTMVVLCMLL